MARAPDIYVFSQMTTMKNNDGDAIPITSFIYYYWDTLTAFEMLVKNSNWSFEASLSWRYSLRSLAPVRVGVNAYRCSVIQFGSQCNTKKSPYEVHPWNIWNVVIGYTYFLKVYDEPRTVGSYSSRNNNNKSLNMANLVRALPVMGNKLLAYK